MFSQGVNGTKEDNDEAFICYKKATQIDETNADAWNNLGNCYYCGYGTDVDYDEAFGMDAQLHPKNIIDHRKFEIKTPDVSIKVAPDKADLIETRVIGGVKYILINAEENVEVNGVSIHIHEQEALGV